MTKPIFFCDLDQTMIYSMRQVDRFTGTYNGLVVVETHADKPHSFMTLDAVNVLRELSQRVTFVPCSTRSPAQFDRVSIPGVSMKDVILDNGGKIFFDKREDLTWTKHVRERIASEATAPLDIYNLVSREFSKQEWFDKIRLTSDMFVAVIGHKEVSPELIDFVEAHQEEWNYNYSVQSRSIYLMPKCVTKEAAAAEIASRYESTNTFAAGDSALDLGLMNWAKSAIRPAHGELAGNGKASHILATTKSGILAGEQILEYVTLLNR